MSKRKTPLPAFIGRKPCGCVVAVSVGSEPPSVLGLTWEPVPDSGDVKFNLCRCEETP